MDEVLARMDYDLNDQSPEDPVDLRQGSEDLIEITNLRDLAKKAVERHESRLSELANAIFARMTDLRINAFLHLDHVFYRRRDPKSGELTLEFDKLSPI